MLHFDLLWDTLGPVEKPVENYMINKGITVVLSVHKRCQ